MTMKIIKLAKPKEFIYPEWTEAIQEAELAERKAKAFDWLTNESNSRFVLQESDERGGGWCQPRYYSFADKTELESIESAMSQSCSEGKEGKT